MLSEIQMKDEELLSTGDEAIKALGSLFKFSQVFLRDDDSSRTHQISSFPRHIKSAEEFQWRRKDRGTRSINDHEGAMLDISNMRIVVSSKDEMKSNIPCILDRDKRAELSWNIRKYWYQKYKLFSKFDCGIKMDEEGWYSVTPERIARHHATRCGSGKIIDGFCGIGGNVIQFAKRNGHVVAIDINAKKIEYARHNATIYGVCGQIKFINDDFFNLAAKLKGDIVFLSPPWGGPNYSRLKRYDINMLMPHNGRYLFDTAKQIASKIVMFLPKNVDVNQLAKLALSSTPPWSLEVEKNFLNGKLKGITAYFNDQTKLHSNP